MTALRDLLRRIRPKYESDKALAEAIGIHPARLSRAINGKGEYANSFSVVSCLRLADASGEPASTVLRAAGKSDVADLIQRLYGSGAVDRLSADEREAIEFLRGLSREARDGLLRFIRLAPKAPRTPHVHPKRIVNSD